MPTARRRLPGDPLPARNRAYHAALDATRGKSDGVVHAAAHAASDVWEPLLREAVEHLRVWGSEDLRDSPMMQRFDEALGQARPT